MAVEPIGAVANAVAETAKATGKAVDLVRDLGAFVGRVLGDAPADLIGVAGGDYLRQVRRRNAFRMAQRTDEIISARHIQETVAISPSLAIPLLSAAGDESRPELQDLWARLLANAMDPARANDLRIEFIEAVKRFHPRDAFIVQKMGEQSGKLSPDARSFFMGHLRLSQAAVEVSFQNLIGTKCLFDPLGSLSDPILTPFGRELLTACRV
jgi:hypothetical protein